MKPRESDIERYHLTTVTLGLHQAPLEDIYNILRYFTAITKVNGLIVN